MKRIILFVVSLLSLCSAFAQSHVECEDTCRHIHGIDLSHYQGNVFWETVGDTKMAYVYLKATEGGDRIDDKYKQNIDLAHRYGLKVGSYHFYRPKISQEQQLANFMTQCRPGDQDLLPMIDIETRSGLGKEEFCYTRSEPVLNDGFEFIMWQYTGKGHLDGINGYVDKSRFMGKHKLREIRFRHH